MGRNDEALNKGRWTEMTVDLRAFAVAAALLIAISAGETASAQKPGGILKI